MLHERDWLSENRWILLHGLRLLPCTWSENCYLKNACHSLQKGSQRQKVNGKKERLYENILIFGVWTSLIRVIRVNEWLQLQMQHDRNQQTKIVCQDVIINNCYQHFNSNGIFEASLCLCPRHIQDPASQRLTWNKPPVNVLVIRKIRDESLVEPFKELCRFLVEVLDYRFNLSPWLIY